MSSPSGLSPRSRCARPVAARRGGMSQWFTHRPGGRDARGRRIADSRDRRRSRCGRRAGGPPRRPQRCGCVARPVDASAPAADPAARARSNTCLPPGHLPARTTVSGKGLNALHAASALLGPTTFAVRGPPKQAEREHARIVEPSGRSSRAAEAAARTTAPCVHGRQSLRASRAARIRRARAEERQRA